MACRSRGADAVRDDVTSFLPPLGVRVRLVGLESMAANVTEDIGPVTRDAPRELAALVHAMRRAGRTPCKADPRFITDEPLPPADVDDMTARCASCNVRGECAAYAAAATPSAGFWAGERYPRRKETA